MSQNLPPDVRGCRKHDAVVSDAFPCLACESEATRLTDDLTAAARRVAELYPTIAGTSILIREANRHVPRNPWDDIADAVFALTRALDALGS